MKFKLIFLSLGILLLGLLWYLWNPVCVAVTQDNINYIKTNNYTPLEKRIDTIWGVKVWQQKQGIWFQCKPSFTRILFS